MVNPLISWWSSSRPERFLSGLINYWRQLRVMPFFLAIVSPGFIRMKDLIAYSIQTSGNRPLKSLSIFIMSR
jgi:hypothetical protein